MARILLTKLHRWLGLTIGVWLILIALSGSLLLYKVELLQWDYPQLELAQMPTQQQAAAVFDRFHIGYGFLPRQENPWVEVVLPDGVRQYYNGEGQLLLERGYLSDWLSFVYEFHHHLLLHKTGKQWMGYFSLLTLLIIVTGFIRWWPQHWSRRVFRIRWAWPWQKGFSAALFQAHKTLAAVLLPVIVVGAVTGAAIMYITPIATALSDWFPQTAPTTFSRTLAQPQLNSWSQRLQYIDRVAPDLQPQVIAMEKLSVRASYPSEWHPNGRTTIQFDDRSSPQLQITDVRDKPLGYQLSQTIYPLHIAAVGGLPWFMVVLLGGLMLLFLPLSGIYFWAWRMRQRHQRRR